MKLARVFTAILLVLVVGFDFTANATVTTPPMVDWNGDVFYKKVMGHRSLSSANKERFVYAH